MTTLRALGAPPSTPEGHLARIERHLARVAEGHDPLGHLFAIERLARAERAERLDALRRPESRAPRP